MKIRGIVILIAVLTAVSLGICSGISSGVLVLLPYGDVSSRSGEQGAWSPVEKDQALAVNSSIRTGVDSYVELQLSPENEVRVKERSQIVIKDLERELEEPDGRVVRLTEFELIDGGLDAILKRLPRDTLVRVTSPTAIAGARGTEFIAKYDAGRQRSEVGVFNDTVQVQSRGELDKAVQLTELRKVSIAPWPVAVAEVRGSGILSEAILGRQFIERSANPVLEETGIGFVEQQAKNNAYYQLAGKILSITVGKDKTINDMLNNNPALCRPLYGYIAGAEVIGQTEEGGKIKITVKLPLAPIADIIGRALPPHGPAVIKPISIEEYSDKFGAQARVTTQRAAQIDGYRKLAELMYDVVINSDTTLADMAVMDDRITTTVQGVVKGAEIINASYYSDGSISVGMTIRADLVKGEVARITGDIFGSNYFTSPVVIGIDDYLWRQ